MVNCNTGMSHCRQSKTELRSVNLQLCLTERDLTRAILGLSLPRIAEGPDFIGIQLDNIVNFVLMI